MNDASNSLTVVSMRDGGVSANGQLLMLDDVLRARERPVILVGSARTGARPGHCRLRQVQTARIDRGTPSSPIKRSQLAGEVFVQPAGGSGNV